MRVRRSAVAVLLGTFMILSVVVSGTASERRWQRGDTVTAADWNRMVDDAGCPAARGHQGDTVQPLAWRLVECFARRLNEGEVESFAKLASFWWRP